jgi:aromatic amino acid aminotransferase I / 2-aminoadipate transaminase
MSMIAANRSIAVANRGPSQLWLKVDSRNHPARSKLSLIEIEEEIFNSCIEKGVLVARGSWFQTEPDKPLKDLFFRATYAAASAQNMNEAIRRFGRALRESFKMA